MGTIQEPVLFESSIWSSQYY